LDVLVDCRKTIEIYLFVLADLCESVIPTTRQGQGLPTPEDPALKRVRWVYPTGWSLQDQAALHHQRLRFRSLFLEGAPPWQAVDEQPWRDILWRSSDPSFPVFITPIYFEVLHEIGWTFFAQTCVNQAGLACALEHYRSTHDQYPETLEALIPHYVQQLPIDVINGSPLKYRRLEKDRFVLYSVGLNGTDDGGKPSPRGAWQAGTDSMPDIEKLDWVWTYPARQSR
jgi:hypothetical protein